MLYQPGTPAPPVRWDALGRICEQRGLRLVTYARPGYSGSTPNPGRVVADAASDVAAVMDALDIEEFITIGHSGGGPHALAAAALLPDRCRAAISLAGVAPFDAPGLDWLDGMAEENVSEFTKTLEGEDELRPYLADQLTQFSGVTAEMVADAFGGLVSEVDRAWLTGEIADVVARQLAQAAQDGLEGWVDDDLAFAKDWGFDLGSIEAPTAIWQGVHDRMVPYAHGEWLAIHVRNTRSRLLVDEGHLSLLTRRLGDVVDDVIDLAWG